MEKRKGEMSKMQRFFEFWGGIWEQNKPTPNMLWMEEVKPELSESENLLSEFEITVLNTKKEIAKRKNWTATGIDGIQKFWCKRFETAQKALRKAFIELYIDAE